MFDDVASKSWAGWPERSRAESGPAASPETEALTISLPIELIDQVRQWASHNEIGLDELRPSLMITSGSSSRLMLAAKHAGFKNPNVAAHRLPRRKHVADAISAAIAERASATRSRIVEEISRLAFSDVADVLEVRDRVLAVNSTTAKTPALTASTTSRPPMPATSRR